MEPYNRIVKKRKPTISIELEGSETIFNVKTLWEDLVQAFNEGGIKTVRLLGAATTEVDTSFVQMICAAKASAESTGKSLVLHEFKETVTRNLLLAGVYT